MRRIFFLSITILLIELLSYLGARGIFWLVKPYLPNVKKTIFVAMFVISHLFLASFFVGQFRFGMGYLALLWLMFLAILITGAFVFILRHIPKLSTALGVLGVRAFGVASFICLVMLAIYNAYTPTTRYLTIQIDKPMPHPVKLAVASDTHLGALVGTRQLHKLADILEREQVDALLMPGDIMDDDTHAYHSEGMAEAFSQVVKSAHGVVIASLGNHDLYREHERNAIASAVRESGAVLLDDKVAQLMIKDVRVTVIGRYDDHYHQRKSTAELMMGVDSAHPVILLDHRPSQIEENVKLPIDLQVSGHTHNGQVFPANLIVKALNRVAYGHEEINDTHVLVSSGYGFWGVPFRLGSQAEVWIVEMRGR